MWSGPPKAGETSVSGAGWTISQESAAITELRTLVERVTSPGRVVEAREWSASVPWLVVVQRREWVLAEQLRALMRPEVPVIWDRRARDRRVLAGPVLLDRRRRDRRVRLPATWSPLRFLVVHSPEPSP